MDLKPTGANQTRVFRPTTGNPVASSFLCTYLTTEESSSSTNNGFIITFMKHVAFINIMCFLCNENQIDALISKIYFGVKLFMFRTVSAWKLSTNLYDINHCWVHSELNSWWWTEELSETCRVSCQNKFVKLVQIVGFYCKEICYDAWSHERKVICFVLLVIYNIINMEILLSCSHLIFVYLFTLTQCYSQ